MNYDLILCGTGFASSFFLKKWLALRPKSRVLVIERGGYEPYADMLANRRQSLIDSDSLFQTSGLAGKRWMFTMGLGGGSTCWWGQTPRMWPEDFQLKSRFGVGYDWPISYDDLELYYQQAEDLMGVAGPERMPYPRKAPLPQPAHRLSSFDRNMVNLVGPDMWVAAPTARSSTGTDNRGKCCANGVCGLCPVDSKFRVMNELASLYQGDDRIKLHLLSEVIAIDIEAGFARGVRWIENGKERSAKGDIVFLGLNALFNPFILGKSGDRHPLTGKRLYEQAGVRMTVDFSSQKNFDGGTHITGLGYMYYGGQQRKNRASCLIESYNSPARIRTVKDKWLSRADLKIVAENLAEDRNEVTGVDQPVANFIDHSTYALKAIEEVKAEFAELLGRLDVIEDITYGEIDTSEGHIQGTTVMGKTRDQGVVDADLRHHDIGNLLVGGSGTFPTGPGTNPSLTIAALSLRAAERLLS